MTFSWDSDKAASNLEKHGVDFREAATVLDDPLSWSFPDDVHSISEKRFITIGMSMRGRLLVVAHTDQNDAIRIISARVATRGERQFYEENESN